MKDNTARRRGEPSPAFASLLPLSVGIEFPVDLPEVVVIDDPAGWGFLFLVVWLVVRYTRRE